MVPRPPAGIVSRYRSYFDDRYSGFDLLALQKWMTDKADTTGRVDLVTAGLPAPLRDAWLPDPAYARVKMDVHPVGQCEAQITADGEVSLDYRAQISNDRGGSGKLSRKFVTNTGRVDHAYFWLPDEEWGAGHAKRLMRRSAEVYTRLGLSSVHITAMAAGKYMWPMCGFQTEGGDGEHEKTLDAMQRFFGDLGYTAALPRFPDLWDFEALDYDDSGEVVVVEESDIYAAFAVAERDFELTGLPKPTTSCLPLSKALLIYNTTSAWPGVLRLERGSQQCARLDAYTAT